MTIALVSQLSYLVLTAALAIWVGETLFRNGRIFVVDAFGGDDVRGSSVNHLLRVGFYLINLGFILFFLTLGDTPDAGNGIVTYLAQKLGVVSIILGGMHYFNMRNLAKMRAKGRAATNPTPAAALRPSAT